MTSATARFGWLEEVRSEGRIGSLSIAGAGHTLLRVAAGTLFLQHGLQKLFGLMGGFMGTAGATAPLFSLMGLAGVLEFAGGLLLIAGFAVRPVALILAGQMVAAFFMAHAPQGGWPIQNGGELPLLFAGVFGFLAANGGGPLSLDRRISGGHAAG